MGEQSGWSGPQRAAYLGSPCHSMGGSVLTSQ